MTEELPLWRATMVALVIVGLVGFAGPATSGATFTDAHDSPGSFRAADSFNGGGSGGPTADAGGPYTTFESDTKELDGIGSTGQNNIAYSWIVTNGPGSLTENTTATPTYHAPPDVSQDTTVTVELTVTDNKGSDTDETTITVQDTDDSTDTSSPKIENFEATASPSGEVTVTFDSNESLSVISVEVARKNKSPEVVLTENDFQESVSGGTYTYTGTASVRKQAKQYTATLTEAKDSAGNDGASDQSDSP